MRPHDLHARLEALEHPHRTELERACAEADAVYRRLCEAMGIPVPHGADPYPLLCARILGGQSIPADCGEYLTPGYEAPNDTDEKELPNPGGAA